MIRFYYREVDGDIVEFTDRVNLAESAVSLSTNAEEGSVATSTLIVDDPDGDWTIGGHRLVYVHEDTADFVRVWVGYSWDRDVKRAAPKGSPRSRSWHVTLNDLNTILTRRIMYGPDNDRPAETDVERMQWLVSTSELGLIDDTTYLSTDAPVDLDAADFDGQYAADVIADCAQASGKNWFVYPIHDGSWIFGLWYGHADLAVYSSGIRVSNDLDDIDDVVTFAASDDTNLNIDPSRVYSGGYMPYDGGRVYRQREATAEAFARRDTSLPSVNVKSSAKAIARTDRILNTLHTEDFVIETTIGVPPEQVNDVLAGHRIEAKFTHLDGYEDFTWMRVLKKTTTFKTPERYELGLTLSAPVVNATAHFLVAYAAQGFAEMQEDLSDNPWTLAHYSGDFTTASVIGCGAGPPANQGMALYYRAIVPGESATVATMKLEVNSLGGMWVYEIAGCDMSGLSVVSNVNEYLADGGDVAVVATATEDSVLFGGVSFGKVNYDGGWLAGGLYSGDIVNDVSGTELVNKSSHDDAGGVPCPWNWIGYATGIGSLSIAANANAHGAGAGAYNCGWNVGKGGLLIPAPDGFSIVQSAFGGGAVLGATYSVTLPSPPTP